MVQKALFILLVCMLLAACAQAAPVNTATAPTAVQGSEIVQATPETQPTVETQPTAVENPNKRTVTSSEFGLSVTYDAALAQDVVIGAVQAVPFTPQILYAESHPAYIGVTFPGYALARPSQMAYPIREPQVMIFRTSDFASYSTEQWSDFPSQKQALEKLLAGGLGVTHWSRGMGSSQDLLPFLPWTNAVQAFFAQAQVLEFPGGKGVRYLTAYSQGPAPVVDPEVFYTFQGLTDDGQYYISAVFPVDTGVFPDAVQPGAMPDIEVLPKLLADQVKEVNALPGSALTPSVELLDEVVQSIEFK